MCDATATIVAMGDVASRELRNNTADVLRRVGAGEEVTVTVRGRPVARVVPLRSTRRGWIGRDELVGRLARLPRDPSLASDLATISGGSTDDLGPIR